MNKYDFELRTRTFCSGCGTAYYILQKLGIFLESGQNAARRAIEDSIERLKSTNCPKCAVQMGPLMFEADIPRKEDESKSL